MGFNYPNSNSESEVLMPPNVQYAISVDGVYNKVLPPQSNPYVVYRIGDGTVHPEGWENITGNKYLDFYLPAPFSSKYYDSIQLVSDNMADVLIVSGNIQGINNVVLNLAKGTNSEILNAKSNATIALTKAGEASTSASNAATSATNALSYLNDFKGRYLGGQASDPVLDLIGNPLNDGDIYFNTTLNEMRVYSATAWKTSVDSYTRTELDNGQLDTRYYTKTEINTANVFRADKYLASQNLSNMVYSANGDLVKIQYNNPTDVDYELFTYTAGDLTGIAHYIGSILKGNSVLSYTNGDLISVVFTGV